MINIRKHIPVKNIYIIIISIIVLLTMAEIEKSITYKSYIDSSYGFFKVRDITTQKSISYDNRTLIINQKDVIIWVNDMEDKALTIISEQHLWENGDVYLVPTGQFTYRFKTPGKYTFYINESPDARQTIIVNATQTSITPNPTPKKTITPAPTKTPEKTAIPKKTVASTPTTNKIHINDTVSNIAQTELHRENRITSKDIPLIILAIFIVIRRIL